MKLKVLSYNIHKGMNLGNREFILNQIKTYLRQLQPDIVFLQEVVGEHHHHKLRIENWPTNAQFEYLADEVWRHYAYGKNAIYDKGHHGNAILSKYPLVNWDNTDLSTNELESRGLTHGKIEIPETGQTLDLFCTHLNLLHKGRKKQVGQIIETIKSKIDSNSPCILAGDFNDWSNDLSTPLKVGLGLKEAFTSLRGSPGKTFPAIWPLLPLDRIYYRGPSVIEVRVLETGPWGRLSDHLPIWAEFQF